MNLVITFTYSQCLNALIEIYKERKLTTGPEKETADTVLKADSYHPKYTITAIPLFQYLQVRHDGTKCADLEK